MHILSSNIQDMHGYWLQYMNNQMMDLPAQMQEMPTTAVNHYPNPLELLSKTIRIKYEEVKSKAATKYNMVRSYSPVNPEKYNQCFNEFQAVLGKADQAQPIDTTKYLPLIFGALQGSSGNMEAQKILIKKFGANIQKLQIDQILKMGKVKSVNYGYDKRKQTNIRQVANKDSFQSMGELYDLKEMKNHRKICTAIKGYLNAMKNFMDCMRDTNPTDTFEQQSTQNMRYIQFANKELGLIKLKISPEILGEGEEAMAEEGQEKKEGMVELNVTPMKKQTADGVSPKEETASGQKTPQNRQQEIKSSQQNKIKPKQRDEEIKARQRRTKQEIQKERLEKLKEKELKALQREEKEKERLLKQQQKERERLAKQKQKDMERQAKEKLKMEKEQQRLAKQKEKQAQRLAKQAEKASKEAQRLAKEAAKQNERIQKQKKNPTLFAFFSKNKAQNSTPVKQNPPQKIQTPQSSKDELFAFINKADLTMAQLRGCFLSQKMKDENPAFKPYYSTVCMSRSRLQFQKFLVNQQRFNQYFNPYEQHENGKYDDSSIEYQDFCGDFCDQKMDAMSVQEEQEASDNSAIVPDSYISQDEISSLNQSKDQIRVKIGQGAEWSFTNPNNYTAEKYVMFCCFDDEPMPLPLNEPQESKELNVNLKCELYKQIHGSYGPKDVLIKKLATIADKVPKSYLDTFIKETTTKRGYQRLVKPQIIDFLSEQRENFAKQLEEIKSKRDEDNMIEMKGRMNERQRQIERLILEEAGTYYIIDMLHFLREKGYRMLKRELKEFIDARTGSQWDDVRRRMSKMQLKGKDKDKEKEKEKMNEFLKKKEKEEGKGKEEGEGKGKEEGKDKNEGSQNQKEGEQLKQESPIGQKNQEERQKNDDNRMVPQEDQ